MFSSFKITRAVFDDFTYARRYSRCKQKHLRDWLRASPSVYRRNF